MKRSRAESIIEEALAPIADWPTIADEAKLDERRAMALKSAHRVL